MSPAKFSVKNALFINLISIIIIIIGVYAWFNIKQEAFPNISLDKVFIATAYPGATPQEIEKLITIPIEEELAEVDDIDEINSTSVENFSSVIIDIDPDAKNKDKVIQDIQRAVDRVDDFPADLKNDPVVSEIKTKNIPVIRISLSGMGERGLRKYADALKDKLIDIPGVASVMKNGWNEREIRVNVDPDKVAEYYLSLSEIMAALKNRNLNVPGGTVIDNGKEFLIRTVGEFETAEEIENVIIRANESGNWIRVKDVAVVDDSFEDDNIIFRTNGERAINLVVVKRESADTIKVVRKVRQIVELFGKSVPKELKLNLFDDMSYYVKRRLNVLVNNGIIGIILVVFSLLLFLHPRVAFLTAIGLPVAFCTTLILMKVLGISINLISMFGMIIVFGMLVDDGIIISENSYRYIENGMPPHDAAIKGTDEVTKPVIATVLTTLAFFFPLFLMSGIIGKYVKHIPQIVILMLLASLFEALFILPSHIADFAGGNKSNSKKPFGSKLLEFISVKYEKLLRSVLKHKYITIFAIVLSFALAFFTYKNTDFILFASEGVEGFLINIEAPVGVSLEYTGKIIRPLEDIVKSLPESELETFVEVVGMKGATGHVMMSLDTGSNFANIMVYLTPDKDRKRKAKEIINEIRKKAKNIAGITKLTFEEVKPGPPVGKPFALRVRGDDFSELKAVSLKVREMLKKINGVSDIEDDYTEGKDELRVVIDSKKAKKLFLTTRDVAYAVRYGFEGGVSTVIKTTDEEVDVVVKFPEERQKSLESFESILIPNKYGKLIPLKNVARLEKVPGISSIKHLDRKRVISVTANVDEKAITSKKLNGLIKKKMKPLMIKHPELTFTFGGENEDTKESMKSLAFAFVWGLLIVYLILASTFDSLIQPSIIVTSVPFGIVSVVFIFFLHRQPLSFFAIMGAIGLAGVAVNDAIVLVEFINNLRERGITGRESIIEGAKLRVRPVLLTTITTVLGLMPVAYGIGGSDPVIKPMALSLSWGLIGATISTLIVIPLIYDILDELPYWVRLFLIPVFFWPLVFVGGKKYLMLHEKEI